jgi:hypothetical protein
MSGQPKVSKMTPEALIEEHKAGVRGLRKMQIVPELQRRAQFGDQKTINHLNSCELQSATAA